MREVTFRYLSQEDCIASGGLDMKGCLKAVERSFLLHGTKNFILPEKPVIRWGGPHTEETSGRIIAMPSYLGPRGPYGPNDVDEHEELNEEQLSRLNELGGPVNTSGIKWVPSRPTNPKERGLPRANAIIIIVDSLTLMPACIMDGTIVSAMRTGAASGVAAKHLANEDSDVMGLIGAGVQGRTQLMAMKETLSSLVLCQVFDLDNKKCEVFREEMEEKIDIDVKICETAREAFREADVVCTATTAKAPYVKSDWYEKGVLQCEISFWDTYPNALKNMDLIVVDDWLQVKHHGVDVSWRAVKEGVIDEAEIYGELGEIVAGKKLGRTSENQNCFFNPIGLGIHDLSEAFRVYKNAKKLGLGKTLNLWKEPYWI